jgi:transposase
LPAYILDGYIKAITFQGSITAEIFEEFLEFYLLLVYNNEPGVWDIIVIDNYLIHYNPRVKEIYVKKGVIIEYLPLYYLIFNLIKESFRDLKVAI